MRPNGSRGFGARRRCRARPGRNHAIAVDLGGRTLRVVDAAGTIVLETAIAIGSPENPTPVGSFFVTDVLDTGDDGSDYGRFAIGISADSLELSEFGGGDGQIGIHGTNQPSSIGKNVSHGCVRVPNEIAVELRRCSRSAHRCRSPDDTTRASSGGRQMPSAQRRSVAGAVPQEIE